MSNWLQTQYDNAILSNPISVVAKRDGEVIRSSFSPKQILKLVVDGFTIQSNKPARHVGANITDYPLRSTTGSNGQELKVTLRIAHAGDGGWVNVIVDGFTIAQQWIDSFDSDPAAD